MNFIKMTCNNCNAQLQIDLDHLQAFCPYCGQKLMMNFDQLGRVLSEKEKTKRTVTREQEQTNRTQMLYKLKSNEKDKVWRMKVIDKVPIFVGCFLALLFVVYFFFFDLMPNPSEKKHDEKVIYLQQIEIEVEDAIKDEDYDMALIKANKLYCDNWSREETATWDAKRESYIKTIQEKKREKDIKNPNNIFMPASPSSFKGKSYADVKEQLLDLGFTNITTKEASESAGWFDKKDTVEHILVGGKMEFTTEDYFDKDTPIIIYYYKK